MKHTDDLLVAAESAYHSLIAASVHYECGLIPLLRHIQSAHPDFAPESVEGALYGLSAGSDERDELETAIEDLRAAIERAAPGYLNRDQSGELVARIALHEAGKSAPTGPDPTEGG